IALPLLPRLVNGVPEESSHWEGVLVEVCGLEAIAAMKSEKPYVLKFDRTDPKGLLNKGDLLLISQKPLEEARVAVAGTAGRYFLARRDPGGKWKKIAPGSLPANS